MDKAILRKLCRDNDLYVTPAINDKLYLHYKGFRSIKNLEEYTGLKVLWLEGNGLTQIEGLENQKELRTLYLHENLIQKIEGLESQLLLDTLNLTQNQVSCIENLDHLKQLTSLALKGNYLTSAKDIAHLLQVPSLSVLDIQSNRIIDTDIVDTLAQLPNLKVLYLQGNEVVKHIKQYRKTMIYRCRQLKYLDDRPVFDDERRRVDAWGKALEASGGDMKVAQEAERQEMDAIRNEKKELDRKNYLYFEQMMIEGRRKRQENEERERMTESPEQATEEINVFSGEKIIPTQDCAFLQQERKMRWEAAINAPEEIALGANDDDENNRNTENNSGTLSNTTAASEAILVDERRMKVLQQCAIVGAASTADKNSFVHTSFRISQAGKGGLIKEPLASEDSTSVPEIKLNSFDQAPEVIDVPSIPPTIVVPPGAPIAVSSAASFSKTDKAMEGEELSAPEIAQQNAQPADANAPDNDISSPHHLLPFKQTEKTENAACNLPPPPPATYTDMNDLD